jgi:hypothetical protein
VLSRQAERPNGTVEAKFFSLSSQAQTKQKPKKKTIKNDNEKRKS